MYALSLYLQPPLQRMRGLHRSMQTKALLGRIFTFLTGHSRSLLDLSTEVSKGKIHSQYSAGYRTVLISQIKGSEGRLRDFDCDFNPLQTHTIDRWVRIAVARFYGATLPAVELIRLGEDYFVRDGHHRISVARAFSEKYIDANVTVLELEPISSPSTHKLRSEYPK